MLFSKPALLFLCVFLKHQGTVEEVVGRTKQGVGGLAAQRLLLMRLLQMLLCSGRVCILLCPGSALPPCLQLASPVSHGPWHRRGLELGQELNA